ncbi:MAG: pknB [Clostridia bacterium]|nr:pknB [Clostridia bacterium]
MSNKQLNNKYRLERKIAQGGMSSIYLCTNIELGNKWIAKHIDRRYSGFIYEEEILKKLNHVNLPQIIDICRDDSGVYIIESYIEGISLQKKLENLGKLDVDKVIDYSLQLCEVLIYLHNMKPKAIIHKDIKPSNIIVTEYDKLILIDFGISEELGSIKGSLTAGTNAYASPEQMRNRASIDTRGDIYSMGVLIYQMLIGQLPGRGMVTNTQKKSIVYKKLLEMSERCSRFLPEERYQRVEEIKKDLLIIRNKVILIKESSKIAKKLILFLIFIISMINYICFIIGLILFKG